jgi:hypothetical protein
MSYNAPANLVINRDLEIAVLYKDKADVQMDGQE